MSEPLVAVLIPVRNGMRTLQAALDSALAATSLVSSAEVVVVEGGSTDGTSEYVDGLAKDHNHSRLRVVHPQGRGLAYALNAGLAVIRARYVARLDADDEMHPYRLRQQIDFLEAEPMFACVGTWAVIGDSWKSAVRTHKHPTEPESLKLALTMGNPFVHSSMLIRRSALVDAQGYCEDAEWWPEDYELWSRLSMHWRLANLPACLTLYREVSGSLSRSNTDSMMKGVKRIAARNVHCLFQGALSQRKCDQFVDTCFGRDGGGEKLSMVQIMAIWERIGVAIGGPRESWTVEFQHTYSRLRNKIVLTFVLAAISPKLLERLKRLKQAYAAA